MPVTSSTNTLFPRHLRGSFDYIIVGAGFAGVVLAERLASQCGKKCLVIDQRNHIGGNSYDYHDAAGVLVHKYGPHYFRTNSRRVVDYLSRFTDWHPVEYKILCHTEGRYWQFPINLNTFEQFIGRPSSSEEMEITLAQWRVPIKNPANSEEVIISQVGWKLYEMFFKNYTRKQWARDPKDLDASVCGRIPIRTNRDDRYLSEKFQALPKDGYTTMFRRMLDHPNIETRLNTNFDPSTFHTDPSAFPHLVYTGMIDHFYGFRFGPLPYRSLRFEFETLKKEYFQPTLQINYPNDHEFTRIVELKHATGQQLPLTTIVREYPEEFRSGKEPYYPVPETKARTIYERYAALARNEQNVTFVGRLALYRYLNMDQVIEKALTLFEKIRLQIL